MAKSKFVVTIKKRKYKPRGKSDAQHLAPWYFKPGHKAQPRSRGGRPPLTRFDMQLRELLKETAPDGTTTLENLVRTLVAMAASGDLDAMKELIALCDGPRVSKSVNVGIRAGNAQLNNPAFAEFLEQQLTQFEDKNNVNGKGQEALPEAIEGTAAED